jgi:hypothetical protein
MIKIDWEAFARQYIWFGYQCVNIIDGKGNWQWSHYWSRRIVPVKRIDWKIEKFKTNETLSTPGFTVYNPVND